MVGDAVLARTVIGFIGRVALICVLSGGTLLGNVTAFFLFASPMPTFHRIWKKKSVEEFKLDPYLAAVINCIFWVFYGILSPHGTLIITVNSIGLSLQLSYLAIFFYLSKQQRCKIIVWLLGEVIFAAVIVCVALLVIHSSTKRSILVGVFSVIFGVFLYSSPLTIMAKVIKTKSVEFMPFWLPVTAFVNGATWMSYALIKVPPTMRIDWYILISNGVGAILAFVQFALYGMYYKSTPKPETSDDLKKKQKPEEVQLSQF